MTMKNSCSTATGSSQFYHLLCFTSCISAHWWNINWYQANNSLLHILISVGVAKSAEVLACHRKTSTPVRLFSQMFFTSLLPSKVPGVRTVHNPVIMTRLNKNLIFLILLQTPELLHKHFCQCQFAFYPPFCCSIRNNVFIWKSALQISLTQNQTCLTLIAIKRDQWVRLRHSVCVNCSILKSTDALQPWHDLNIRLGAKSSP